MLHLFLVGATLIQATQPSPPGLSPVEGDWLVEVVDNIGVMPDAPITLTFRGSRVLGSASCNTYMGTYRVSGTSIATESILSTMKACDGPRMSQERDFLSVLRRVTRFEMRTSETLELVTDEGKTMTARRKTP